MFNLILLLCLYLPFQVALNPAESVDLASVRVFILIMFFLWLAFGLKHKKIIIVSTAQSLFITSFLFISFISIFAARNTDWGERKLLFLFSIFPLYFVASGVLGSRQKALKAIKYLLISGTAVAAIGILEFLGQFIFGLKSIYALWANFIIPPFLGKSFSIAVLANPSWLVNISGSTYLRATSLFPDPHMFSFYLGLLAPLALGMFLKTRRAGYLVSFFVLIIADILTFSRGGYLGIFMGILALFLLSWKKISKGYRIATVILVIASFIILAIPGPISSRFFSSFDLKEGSNAGRIEMWTKAWEVVSDHPFLGVGIGNYPLEVKASADYREPIYAHNTYLDIAAEMGILAALFWMAILIWTFLAFIKMSRQDILFLYAAVSLVVFAAHSFFETGIYSPVVLALFLIIISFANGKTENEKMD